MGNIPHRLGEDPGTLAPREIGAAGATSSFGWRAHSAQCRRLEPASIYSDRRPELASAPYLVEPCIPVLRMLRVGSTP